MNLDIVWQVFYNIMKDCIEVVHSIADSSCLYHQQMFIKECCKNPPQSPIRELLERKNCKARFT